MKKFATLLLAAVMTITLAGCGTPASNEGNNGSSAAQPGYAQDGYAEGRLNDTMHTYFFDFTINSAYVCNEYNGYKPASGHELVVAEATIKNTMRESIPMFDSDFQIQWGGTGEDDFEFPITYSAKSTDNLGEDLFPAEYTLGVNEKRTGLLVYEVPEGKSDFNISFLEEFDNDTTGDLFFVYFTAEHK